MYTKFFVYGHELLVCLEGVIFQTQEICLGVTAKEHYKRDDILQKRPIILRSLLIIFQTQEICHLSDLCHTSDLCHVSGTRRTMDTNPLITHTNPLLK